MIPKLDVSCEVADVSNLLSKHVERSKENMPKDNQNAKIRLCEKKTEHIYRKTTFEGFILIHEAMNVKNMTYILAVK